MSCRRRTCATRWAWGDRSPQPLFFYAGHHVLLRQHELGLALPGGVPRRAGRQLPAAGAVHVCGELRVAAEPGPQGGGCLAIARLYGEEHVRAALTCLEMSKASAEEGLINATPKKESMFAPRYCVQLLGGIMLSCAQQLACINTVL